MINSKSIYSPLIAPQLNPDLWKAIIPYSQKIFFPGGVQIYSQDIPSKAMFCIESGSVKLSHLLKDGFESVVSLYSSGNIFGELSAFATEALNPMATALSDTHARAILAEDARILIRNNPDFSEFISKSLIQKLNCMTRQMYLIAGKSVFGRIVSVLPVLHAYGYIPDAQGWYTITHAELASLIGTTRPQVTTHLNRLESLGVLKLKRNQIKLLNMEKIKELSY